MVHSGYEASAVIDATTNLKRGIRSFVGAIR